MVWDGWDTINSTNTTSGSGASSYSSDTGHCTQHISYNCRNLRNKKKRLEISTYWLYLWSTTYLVSRITSNYIYSIVKEQVSIDLITPFFYLLLPLLSPPSRR